MWGNVQYAKPDLITPCAVLESTVASREGCRGTAEGDRGAARPPWAPFVATLAPRAGLRRSK
jgi:hypothetical protein